MFLLWPADWNNNSTRKEFNLFSQKEKGCFYLLLSFRSFSLPLPVSRRRLLLLVLFLSIAVPLWQSRGPWRDQQPRWWWSWPIRARDSRSLERTNATSVYPSESFRCRPLSVSLFLSRLVRLQLIHYTDDEWVPMLAFQLTFKFRHRGNSLSARNRARIFDTLLLLLFCRSRLVLRGLAWEQQHLPLNDRRRKPAKAPGCYHIRLMFSWLAGSLTWNSGGYCCRSTNGK